MRSGMCSVIQPPAVRSLWRCGRGWRLCHKGHHDQGIKRNKAISQSPLPQSSWHSHLTNASPIASTLSRLARLIKGMLGAQRSHSLKYFKQKYFCAC